MNSLWKVVKNNCFIFKIVFLNVPGLIIYNILFNIFSGLIKTLTGVYVTKYVLDSFQYHKEISQIIIFLLIIVLANVGVSVLEAYYKEVFYLKQKEILCFKINKKLFNKSKNVELSCYETPQFYNDFIWALNQSDGKILGVIETTGNFLQLVARIIVVIGIIVSVEWTGLIIVGISGIIKFLIQVILNKSEYELSVKQVPIQRKRDYFSRIVYLPDYAKEIRLNNVGDKLIKNFREVNKNIQKLIHAYGIKQCIIHSLDVIGNELILINGIYILYLLYLLLVEKRISYGGYIALYQGVKELNLHVSRWGNVLSVFQKNSLYIERFRKFLNYESKIKDDGVIKIQENSGLTIEFKHVFFRYEEKGRDVLYDINLKLCKGERIALVGHNGAGKSTLVKILLRLYEPTEGSIELNGIDIRKFSLGEYYSYLSVVFQDFKLFAATIAENVMMDIVKSEDKIFVKKALDKSGFINKLNTLSNGLSTLITKEFSEEGIDLSGGEAQMVAISRIFAHENLMIILDEPSSNLDPMMELFLNKQIMRETKDEILIYISHRLSTTKIADRIIYIDKGQITEEGTHVSLMELNGKYAEMFKLQAKKYLYK